MRRILSVGVVIALAAAGCTNSGDSVTSVPEPAPTTSTVTSSTLAPTTSALPSPPSTLPAVVPSVDERFAGVLVDVPLITEGSYDGPTWPRSLSGVAFQEVVPEALRHDMVRDGFVIEKNSDTYGAYGIENLTWMSQFANIYEQLSPYGARPVFVTTDVAYHMWHQVFDMVLRQTEQEELLPILERLVADLVEASRVQAASVADPVVQDAALRAQEHLEAIATVLGLDVGSIGDSAAEEVALIDQATDFVESPTVGGSCSSSPPTASCVDYSLTRPRGHYTRSEELTRYFKAMAVLGNTGFSLNDLDTLRVGLLIARLIVTDLVRAEDWGTIYGPTAFLVGAADDYTPFEAATAAGIAGVDLADPASLAADGAVEAVAQALVGLREVKIDAGRASLRTMGSRFVLDSWIYDQLTDPSVSGRMRPTPLDLSSVMGSAFAASYMEEQGEDATFPDYRSSVETLQSVVSNRTIDDWGRTVYDAWLYALEPMWREQHTAAFPPFMRTSAWQSKSQNTGLSSYTELKHDTILYAKQGIAEGEGPPAAVPPRHWVEPDPTTFGRLSAVATMMRDGLVDAGLMVEGGYDSEDGDPLSSVETRQWMVDLLIMTLDRLHSIALDELAALPISEDDNMWLGSIGEQLAMMIEVIGEGALEPSPVVADAFLDPSSDAVLELGTGPLDAIHVLVPDDRGGFEVATGAVYSYFEFWGPRSERLTDEEWWDRIIADDLPDRPSWWLDRLG